MRSLLNLALIGLVGLGTITLVSCCKPEGTTTKPHHSHHEHSKMHHEHGDK